METIWSIVYAIFGFGILVFFHELGHFWVGRASGIGVETFSIGFGRGILKWKRKGIEYKIGWIPLGGYCKFKGQSDFGEADVKHESDEFYERPRWARFITVAAGPVFSLLLGVLIMAIMLFFFGKFEETYRTIEVTAEQDIGLRTGDEILRVEGQELQSLNQFPSLLLSLPPSDTVTLTVNRGGDQVEVEYPFPDIGNTTNTDFGFEPYTFDYLIVTQFTEDSPAKAAGLQEQDKILEANGVEVNSQQDLSDAINNPNLELVEIQRELQNIKLFVPASELMKYFPKDEIESLALSEAEKKIYFPDGIESEKVLQSQMQYEDSPVIGYPYIREIYNDDVEDAYFREGDVILYVNEQMASSFETIKESVFSKENYQQNPVKIVYERNDTIKSVFIQPNINNERRIIGVYTKNYDSEVVHIEYGVFESIGQAVQDSAEFIVITVYGIARLVTGDIDFKTGVVGPVIIFKSIGEVGAKYGFYEFLRILAIISLLLGFFNILPLPALDGGHLLLTTIESLRRKNFKIETIQKIQFAGFIILISFALLVVIKDFIYWDLFSDLF